jgi:hypothetical protein
MTSHFSPENGLAASWKWEVLQHSPHSPDLVPSGFYLFWLFKDFYHEKDLRTKVVLQKNSFAVLHFPWKGTLP